MDVKRFFADRLREYGVSHKALDWSREGQTRRFEVMSEVGDFHGRSVLDLGSGLGHFCAFLEERSKEVRYTGYDFSEAFVREAVKRLPRARFEVRDVLRAGIDGKFDFVVSSGLHNLETGTNDSDMEQLLEKAWAAANVAVAINMLSARAKEYTQGRHYYEPERFLAAAMDLTPYVVLRHDYMPHDFTLYLHREARGA